MSAERDGSEVVASTAHGADKPVTVDKRELTDTNEPPVVARLVIEIRSDGTRTIARGGLEDHAQGQKVMIEAEGATPMELALSLARSMFKLPAFVRTATQALLPGKGEKPGRKGH